jgi:hypothetical protein
MIMTDNTTNTEHLHKAGIINKADLDKDNIEAIDSLSKEEVEHLKSIDKNMKKVNKGVGIFL